MILFLLHQLSANVGAGVQLENGKIFRYILRGKKAVSFTSDGLLGLNIKGRILADKDFKPVLLHCTYSHFTPTRLMNCILFPLFPSFLNLNIAIFFCCRGR